MNPDPNRTDLPTRSFDEEQLGALVRGVADSWRMPPQRLDLPTWRDRTRSGGVGRRSWLARLAVPALTALVATLVLAVAAVWLTTPRGDRGVVAGSPTPSVEPRSSSGPVSTPLPRLFRNGDLPSVTRVMVQAEGHYRLADLATGTLGVDAISSFSWPTALLPRPAGGWLCVCVTSTAFGAYGPTGLSMTLASIDAAGNLGEQRDIRRVDGTLDPNERSDLQFQLVDAAVSVAPDGRTAFFAWTARNGGVGWTSGIDVIDVVTGTVASSAALPVVRPAGFEGKPISRLAPRVKVAPAGDRILLAGFWYIEDPNNPNPGSGTDRWTAPFDGQTIGGIAALSPTSGSDCAEFDSGLIDSTSYYVVCGGQSADLTVRRVTLGGRAIGDTAVPRTEEEFTAGSLVARSADGLYIWDPVAAVMSRVDLGTGALTQSPTASASHGGTPLDALAALGRRVGRWIAPSVAAKLLLEPGIVLSPDGTRVYAIGVSSPARTDRGSTGIFAFDTATLAQLGQWAPTADFSSIAVSADGRFVYAAAVGGVDAGGSPAPNGASVTVFDTTDGSVRLIAGKLGSSDLWFVTPTLK